MAETTPFVSGDSPEAIAYALLMGIAKAADRQKLIMSTPVAEADKAWVLDTYAECLQAAKGNRAIQG